MTKNVSFLLPIHGSGKMMLPRGLRTLLARMSSMRRVFSRIGQNPWGMPNPRLDLKTLRNFCPPLQPMNLGTCTPFSSSSSTHASWPRTRQGLGRSHKKNLKMGSVFSKTLLYAQYKIYPHSIVKVNFASIFTNNRSLMGIMCNV